MIISRRNPLLIGSGIVLQLVVIEVGQYAGAVEATVNTFCTRNEADMWQIRPDNPSIVENGAGASLHWIGVSSRDYLDVFDYSDGNLKVRISAWRYAPSEPPQPVDTYTVDLGWGIGRVGQGVGLAKAEEIAADIREALLVWSKGVICNAMPPITKVVFDMSNWPLWPVGRQLP